MLNQAQFNSMVPAAPVALLDARFHASIVTHPKFYDACEFGYDLFFQCDELAERCYTWDGLKADIARDVLIAHDHGGVPLHACAGVVLGWLSALAHTHRDLALRGLELLEVFVGSYPQCVLGSTL